MTRVLDNQGGLGLGQGVSGHYVQPPSKVFDKSHELASHVLAIRLYCSELEASFYYTIYYWGSVGRRSTRSKRPSTQALESLGASPPRRRHTAATSLPSSGNDSETAAQSAVLLSGPSSHASEPAIPATGPAFPPALFDQLVQRVAAEVTRQLQPASFLPAVQEPQVPSPAPAAFPSLAGTTDVQQLTTEVPVVSSSPVGNPSAVDQATQVVQSVHSSLAGESPSTGAFQPKDIFASVHLRKREVRLVSSNRSHFCQ